MQWEENGLWSMATSSLMKARSFGLRRGVLGSGFNHKFISENCNMAVFINESKQYDLSVDGVKFSVLYNQIHGAGNNPQPAPAPTESLNIGQSATEQPSTANDFGFSFNPGNFAQNRPVQGTPAQPQDNFGQSLRYENPEKIFANGSNFGEFKFDGFGKEAWGLYSASSGYEGQQSSKGQDFFSSPFDKNPQTHQGTDFGLHNQEDGSGGMWVKDAPVEAKVVEDTSKGKRGFM
jgi:hypothetical protein